MKLELSLIYIILMFLACKDVDNYENIKGSWYSVKKGKDIYEEIHIDDSLLIYCYDYCNLLLPFNYSIRYDSVYLFLDKNEAKYKYKISFSKSNEILMHLTNEQEQLIFTKMDKSYENLNVFLKDYESLDSLSSHYFRRRSIILDSLYNQ